MARDTDNRTNGARPTVGHGKPLGRDRINQQLDKEQRDDIRALRTLPQWLRESSGLDGWLAAEEKRLGMPSVRNGRGHNASGLLD
jgi:hypothetical protein